MKITKIEKKKGRRYQIEVDGEYWYILDIEIIYDFHLKEDMEVEEAFLNRVKEAAEYRKAKERALYLLGVRDYGRNELIRKLGEKVSLPAARKAVEKMEELGLLNDEAYAEKLGNYLFTEKHFGVRRVRFELEKKGFSSEVIEKALESAGEREEDLSAFIRRKYVRYLGDEKGRQKVLMALSRMGHSYGDALDALEQAISAEEEES